MVNYLFDNFVIKLNIVELRDLLDLDLDSKIATLKDSKNLPSHVSFIMDGNRRWAKANSKTYNEAYKSGIDRMSEIVDTSIELKIPFLTFFAFSMSNWNRDDSDVSSIMKLGEEFLSFSGKKRIKKWVDKGVKIKFIGKLSLLTESIRNLMSEIEKDSENNNFLTLQIAISYSGRDEIVQAAKKIAEKVEKKKLSVSNIDERCFSLHLFTSSIPDPDFVIRTGKEKRISDFLIWQSNYSEFFFSDKMWPDFVKESFLDSIFEYQFRNRRYGSI